MALCEKESVERCQRITDTYLLVMLAGFPFFAGLSGYLYLHLKKFIFFAAATIIWAACLLIEVVRRRVRGGRLASVQLPESLLCIFAVMATISTLRSPYVKAVFFDERYDSLLTFLLYVVVFAGVYRFGEVQARYLYAFAVSYTACCMIALLQLLGWNPLWLFPYGINYYDPVVQETGKFLGTVGNIDILSALHCLAIPAFASYIVEETDKRRGLLLLPVFMGVACQVLADVAAGLLALCVTAMLFLPAAGVNKYQAHSGKQLPMFLRLSGIAMLLIAVALLYVLPIEEGTLYEIRQVLHGNLEDEFGSHRILIWRKVWAVFQKNALLGVGPGNLRYYLDIHFERYSSLLGETLRAGVDNAHSEYLQFLASFGIAGALPIAVLAIYTAMSLIRAQSASGKILAPCLICYMIQAAFNVSFCIVTPLLCIVWAMALPPNISSRHSEKRL